MSIEINWNQLKTWFAPPCPRLPRFNNRESAKKTINRTHPRPLISTTIEQSKEKRTFVWSFLRSNLFHHRSARGSECTTDRKEEGDASPRGWDNEWKRNHYDVLTKILVNKALPHTGPTKVEKSDNKEERRKGRRKGSEGSRDTRKYEEGTKSKGSDFRAETENERKIYETSTLPAFIESECTSESGTRLREWLSNGARATRFYSANNVFVYSTRVLENRRIMVLVYVHQYLDSSRKPNQWVADLLGNSWRTRESSIQELQLASWIRYGGKLRLELRAILRGILREEDN